MESSVAAALAEQNQQLQKENRELRARLQSMEREYAGRVDSGRRSRRLIGELAHAGRISTMSEMASGLAHELNQPLAAIVAYVDACQELVESGRMNSEQLIEVLRSVSGQAERAGQIIHRLRKMIKRSQPVRSAISVNDAVRDVAEILHDEAQEGNITVQLELGEHLPEPVVDLLQIQQVLLHIVRNGLEAMSGIAADRRLLTISTSRTPAGEVEVAVRDQGEGLPDDVAGRVFEPFFTTKTNGLGLGLSISRTIVDAHGGRMSIAPERACGAVTRFILPASPGEATHGPDSNRVHRR
jgi:C4-dicarboxylate-specific signal transduction histidine kinase